jgi:hypothetical protein
MSEHHEPNTPTLGRILHYRGKLGLQTMRAAIVTATIDTIDPAGVEAGEVEPITDPTRVHLWVYSPSANNPAGGFGEFNVAYGGDGLEIPPGTWRWPVIQARVETEGQ